MSCLLLWCETILAFGKLAPRARKLMQAAQIWVPTGGSRAALLRRIMELSHHDFTRLSHMLAEPVDYRDVLAACEEERALRRARTLR